MEDFLMLSTIIILKHLYFVTQPFVNYFLLKFPLHCIDFRDTKMCLSSF